MCRACRERQQVARGAHVAGAVVRVLKALAEAELDGESRRPDGAGSGRSVEPDWRRHRRLVSRTIKEMRTRLLERELTVLKSAGSGVRSDELLMVTPRESHGRRRDLPRKSGSRAEAETPASRWKNSERPGRSLGASSVRARSLIAAGCLSIASDRLRERHGEATVREAPRVLTIPGDGDYRWEPETGWVQPEIGRWGPGGRGSQRRPTEAFQAKAYADAPARATSQLERSLEGATTPLSRRRTTTSPSATTISATTSSAIEYYRKVYREGKPEQTIADTTRAENLRDRDRLSSWEGGLHRVRNQLQLSSATAIDLLTGEDGLITEYPHLHFADDALMEIARYYFDSRQYPEAAAHLPEGDQRLSGRVDGNRPVSSSPSPGTSRSAGRTTTRR